MFSTKTQQFAWKELTLLLDGRPMIELTDIEYKPNKVLEEIFAAGDNPQFIGEGNKTYSGSLEVLQSGYEALVTEAKKRGGNDVTDLELDAIISYVPLNKDAATVAMKTIVDRVSGIKFESGGKKFSQGNTHIKVALPFKALRIDNQI
ncbi:MAG: hypothetical protein N4A74_21445 [Carboxylicivirga sp.]|jgi:hypothetical protein|nr:hypothetical protein [Carboxylicivirga sp.]